MGLFTQLKCADINTVAIMSSQSKKTGRLYYYASRHAGSTVDAFFMIPEIEYMELLHKSKVRSTVVTTEHSRATRRTIELSI